MNVSNYRSIFDKSMYLKIILLLTMVPFSGVPLYSAQKGNLQDSVKRVTVKITATERSPSLNLDSLLRGIEAAKQERKSSTIQSRKSSPSIVKKVTKRPSSLTRNTEPAIRTSSRIDQRPVSNTIKVEQERKSLEVEKSAPEITTKTEPEQIQKVDDQTIAQSKNIRASRIYLWVGFILMTIGVFLGIFFGKTALLVSIAGIVLVVIGYKITH